MRSSAACWASGALAAVASALLASGAAAGDGPTLEEIVRRMGSATGVATRFVETKELALLARPIESRGLLYFVPPDRLARFTIAPYPAAFLVDEDRIRYRDAADGQMQDLSGSPTARAWVENFSLLFAGDLARLERTYLVSLEAGDASGWRLELVPRRPPLDRVIEGLTLRGDDGGLREMVLREKNGDRTRVRFEATDLDRTFSEAEIERLFEVGAPLGPGTAPEGPRAPASVP